MEQLPQADAEEEQPPQAGDGLGGGGLLDYGGGHYGVEVYGAAGGQLLATGEADVQDGSSLDPSALDGTPLQLADLPSVTSPFGVQFASGAAVAAAVPEETSGVAAAAEPGPPAASPSRPGGPASASPPPVGLPVQAQGQHAARQQQPPPPPPPQQQQAAAGPAATGSTGIDDAPTQPYARPAETQAFVAAPIGAAASLAI